jgi:5'(3')-deoxyribonucleotidase
MARINVDCDGVVCDFIPGLFGALKAIGLDPGPIDHPNYRTWDVLKNVPEECSEPMFEMLKEHEFWEKLPVIDGAQEAILALREAGHHIHWVTSPWEKCFGWRDARHAWLNAHFDHPQQNLSKDLTVTGTKDFIWADVFIDDKADHIRGWHAHHPGLAHRAILYKTSFNVDHHDDLDHIEWSEDSVAMILAWLREKYHG